MKFHALILLSFFALLTGCRPAAPPISVSTAPVSINDQPVTTLPMPPSKPVEEMTWTTFDGKTEKLGDFKGKVVILDFWATYCPPCVEEIPHLKALQEKFADKLVVIGLHAGGDEDKELVPEFLKKHKVTYTIATPERELTSFIFGQRDDIPQTAVFDREGKLVQQFVGYGPNVKSNLDEVVIATVGSN